MKRQATAVWEGDLRDGRGRLTTQSGVLKDNRYSFAARIEDESGTLATNPEELIAAAHAGCFAMQLSHFLAENGTPATSLEASAEVELVPGKGITASALTLKGEVPGIDEEKFRELADQAKAGCPVSKALSGVQITLEATLA